VADLVPEVTEHGAVRLAETHPHLLAVGGVGLVEIESDHSVGVPSRHRFPLTGEQIEGESSILVAPSHDRQPELGEFEHQPAFRDLSSREAL
jgi:hypothetical protein